MTDFRDLAEYKAYWTEQTKGEYQDVAYLMLAAVEGWDTLEQAEPAINLCIKMANDMQKQKLARDETAK